MGNKSLSKTEVDILEKIHVACSSLTTTIKVYQEISLNLHKIHHLLNISLLTLQIQLSFNHQLLNLIQIMTLIIYVQAISVTRHPTYLSKLTAQLEQQALNNK